MEGQFISVCVQSFSEIALRCAQGIVLTGTGFGVQACQNHSVPRPRSPQEAQVMSDDGAVMAVSGGAEHRHT